MQAKSRGEIDSRVACDQKGGTLLYPKVAPGFDFSDPKPRRIAEVFEEVEKREAKHPRQDVR